MPNPQNQNIRRWIKLISTALLGIYHQGVSARQQKRSVVSFFVVLLPAWLLLRFDMIPQAEWRLEVRLSTSLFRNWKSHETKMYDFCFGLPEYLDNRETIVFLKKTLDFLFICFTHTSTYVHPVCGVIIGFDDVNSIICKQVYSFFQNIKRSNHMLHQNSFYLEQ